MQTDPQTLEVLATASIGPVEVIQLGKDEMNLAEFPITLLTDRVPKGKTTIQYQDVIFDEKSGKRITRKLTISAGEVHGLPTAVDDDVILGLIQLTKNANNFTSREIEFSRLDLIRTLGWPDSGDSYRRLSESLKRWLSVTLLYENAWRDNRKGAWITKGFHILDNIELNDTRTVSLQGELFPSKIAWNKVVFDSFAAGYLKTIDYRFYINLHLSVSRRMYRFLSKRAYFSRDMTFDLRDLALSHIGLSDTYRGNAGKIKEKLQPGIEELESSGFLEPLSKDERYAKVGKDWKIRIKLNPDSPTIAAIPPRADVEADTPPLVAELVSRGVTEDTAARLVQQHAADKIGIQIEVFDWLREKKDKKVSTSPAGYLVKSITTGEKGYAIPEGFEAKAVRQARQAAKQEGERKAAQERRRQQEEQARTIAVQKAIASYWKSLTKPQQAELDAAALATASAEDLELLHGPFKQTVVSLIRDKHIKAVLVSQGTLPAENVPPCPENAPQSSEEPFRLGNQP